MVLGFSPRHDWQPCLFEGCDAHGRQVVDNFGLRSWLDGEVDLPFTGCVGMKIQSDQQEDLGCPLWSHCRDNEIRKLSTKLAGFTGRGIDGDEAEFLSLGKCRCFLLRDDLRVCFELADDLAVMEFATGDNGLRECQRVRSGNANGRCSSSEASALAQNQPSCSATMANRDRETRGIDRTQIRLLCIEIITQPDFARRKIGRLTIRRPTSAFS